MPPKRAARAAVDAQEGAPASKRKQASRAGSGATKSAVPDAPVAVASKRAAGNAAASAAAGRRGKAASGKAASGGAAAAEVAAGAAPAAAPGGGRQFFLMKSEPDVFSIDDLEGRPGQTEPWDGVRSHQAKKVLQSMRLGDQAFFYHSNAKPPGVVGIVEIVREAYPDPSQFDPGSKYYDASCEREAPKWVQVDCRLVRRLARQAPPSRRLQPIARTHPTSHSSPPRRPHRLRQLSH